MGIVIGRDCACLPYFLRADFAFKMGLPFGYAKCSRGGGGQPPKCFQWFSIQNLEAARASSPEQKTASSAPAAKGPGLATSFGHYLRTTADAVHSRSARTAANDQNTDYYPIPLTHGSLRPAPAYTDPHGHVFALARP